MTKPLPVPPAPAPLEAYAQHFDSLFAQRNQRAAFRRYLEGLLLAAERNKTVTALANTKPIVGAQQPEAQRLQWFVSESTWSPQDINAQRLALLMADPATAPTCAGVLVIDESGDRKAGTKTAHVGRQYLANIGQIDNGVVSVSSVWADEQVYYPVDVEPYTPAHSFTRGKTDPQFRTKPQIAVQFVQQAVARGLPFRAVVADCFYGEHDAFKQGVRAAGVGYVLALQPSHAWWHPVDEVGTLWEVAQAAGWRGPAAPGAWVKVERRFHDGHVEDWWAVEIIAGPYGPAHELRAVVVTTDPVTLPHLTTWYLETNLPAPGPALDSAPRVTAADLAEVVRLYSVRMWIEQSSKQMKHTLGWAQ